MLTGKLRSLTFLSPVKEYSRPEQHFGADGLTEHGVHTEDIAAVDTSEILILSSMAFRKFSYAHFEIAHKIIRTIRSKHINRK
jgi:CRP-like cAMP-binding protein